MRVLFFFLCSLTFVFSSCTNDNNTPSTEIHYDEGTDLSAESNANLSADSTTIQTAKRPQKNIPYYTHDELMLDSISPIDSVTSWLLHNLTKTDIDVIMLTGDRFSKLYNESTQRFPALQEFTRDSTPVNVEYIVTDSLHTLIHGASKSSWSSDMFWRHLYYIGYNPHGQYDIFSTGGENSMTKVYFKDGTTMDFSPSFSPNKNCYYNISSWMDHSVFCTNIIIKDVIKVELGPTNFVADSVTWVNDTSLTFKLIQEVGFTGYDDGSHGHPRSSYVHLSFSQNR